MDDQRVREVLGQATRIAVVGIKAGADDDAFRVPGYMQARGYEIVPISPKLDRVLGEPVFRSLADVPGPIDMVNLFRAPQHIPAHVDEILALDPLPKSVWLQLGIRCAISAQRLTERGVDVVEDRCLMVEHRRLMPG